MQSQPVNKQAVNNLEHELKQKYLTAFENGEARIERNILIHGFECDMILFHLKGLQTFNYEFNDPNHRYYLTKQRFCKKRDIEYLTNVVHGVQIIRRRHNLVGI